MRAVRVDVAEPSYLQHRMAAMDGAASAAAGAARQARGLRPAHPHGAAARGMSTGGLDGQVRDVPSAFWPRPSAAHGLAGAHLAAEVDNAGVDVRLVARPTGDARARRCAPYLAAGSLALTPPRIRVVLSAVLVARNATRALRGGRRRQPVR